MGQYDTETDTERALTVASPTSSSPSAARTQDRERVVMMDASKSARAKARGGPSKSILSVNILGGIGRTRVGIEQVEQFDPVRDSAGGAFGFAVRSRSADPRQGQAVEHDAGSRARELAAYRRFIEHERGEEYDEEEEEDDEDYGYGNSFVFTRARGRGATASARADIKDK